MAERKQDITAHKRTDRMKKEFINALVKCMGNVTATCSAMGMERKTYYLWLQRDEVFAKEVQEALFKGREKLVDLAEKNIAEKAAHGDTTAAIFILKTQGKARGWVEKAQVEMSGQTASKIEIEIIDGNAEKNKDKDN